MSAFRDMVASDIDTVFLNTDEFAEEHEIEGKNVICIISDEELLDKQGGAVWAVGQVVKTLCAKCDDLPTRKGYGAELMVDGIPYVVEAWSEDMGMATIKLSITANS